MGKQEKRARGPFKCFSGYGRENGLQLPGKIQDQRIGSDHLAACLHLRKTGSGSGLFFWQQGPDYRHRQNGACLERLPGL